MSLNSIDFNGIKSSVIAAYQTASTRLGEWKGRVIAWIQLGIQTAMPYLQDKKIAVISLIAVTLLFSEISNVFSYLLNKYLPDNILTDSIDVAGSIAILAGGVVGFVKYTQLPLTSLAVLGISVGTLVARSALSKP